MTSKATTLILNKMSDRQIRKRIEQLSAVAGKLRKTKPQSLARTFGSRGPTADQLARWKTESTNWSRLNRANSDEMKTATGISNERHQRRAANNATTKESSGKLDAEVRQALRVSEDDRLDDEIAYASAILSRLNDTQLDSALSGEVARRGRGDAELRQFALDQIHPDDLVTAIVRNDYSLSSVGLESVKRTKKT